MKLVYSYQKAPEIYSKSIFLAGPTPRDAETSSWRPDAIEELRRQGYNGVVFIPEPEGTANFDYDSQVEWEKTHLALADIILFWIPRNLQNMPAFTTNVEFGTWIDSGKVVYGRPDNSPKNRYLDWIYEDHKLGTPHNSLQSTISDALSKLKTNECGAERRYGERNVPLHIWSTPMFWNWYQSLKLNGNRLDDAKLLWQYQIRGKVFSFALWVKVWVESEQRYKENEFVLSRTDIATIVAYQIKPNIMDSEIVLVKEFRSPVRNSTGMAHELPGGSSFSGCSDWSKVASEEFYEETGLQIHPFRFELLNDRQMVSTLSSHKATLYGVELLNSEMITLKQYESDQNTFGVEKDSEKTYVEVRTLKSLLNSNDVDWSMLGMIFQGIHYENYCN